MKADKQQKGKMSFFQYMNQERFRVGITLVTLAMILIFIFLWNVLSGNHQDRKGEIVVYSERHLDVDYDFGYDNFIKRGRFLPINVHYRSSDTMDFRGNIHFKLTKNHTDEIVVKYPVEVAAMEENKETYYVFLEYDMRSLQIILLDEEGKVLVNRMESFEYDLPNSTLAIGVLSDDVERLDYFNNVSIDYGMLTTNLIDLSMYPFPTFERGLDQLDVVLISNYRIRDLDVIQSRALMNWVSDGGVLIMGTGERVDDTLGRYAPELLEDMYGNPELREVSLGSYKEAGNVVQQKIILPIADFNLHGGNIIFSDGGTNLMSAINRDNGLIAVAAYDFCDISQYARIHNSFVNNLLVQIFGRSRIYKLTYDDGVMMDSIYKGEIDALVDEGRNHNLPPIMWTILILTVYLFVIGPLLFMYLKSKNLLHLYTYFLVFFSLFFSYIIYALGNDTRVNGLAYNYASIFDYSDDNVVERSFVALRSPYNAPYRFSLPKEYSILPFVDSVKDVTPSRISNVSIDYRKDKTELDIGYIGGFQSITIDLRKSAENTDGYGFVGELNFFNNEITGEITSNFDFPVEDVAVLLYGKIVVLGDFIARETKFIDESMIQNVPLGEVSTVSLLISGGFEGDDNSTYSEDYFISRKRNDVLEYFIGKYYSGYTVDAKVIGFTDRHMLENVITPSGLDYFGVNLLTSSLPVNNREDERIYRSALMKSPLVVSGEYYRESNTTYNFEPTVLEYDLGDDISIEGIDFQFLSSDLKDFSLAMDFTGDISLLNIYNDNFDPIDSSKTVLDVDDLLDYITVDNHITIRYSHRLESPNDSTVFLPMIYVLGTEY